ncbi:MAG: GNAT family N-acetyltransferase [Verrucomicrobiae bacterium]|nr:GNAT family N-acetyltransferase [Verrucomicrobiae bacterium]
MADDPSPSLSQPNSNHYPIVILKDGSRAELRPLTPQDKPRVQEAFRRLSHESRFRRFFTPLEVLDGALLERLTSGDGIDHVVWAAMNPDDRDDPGMGAASFWRSKSDPSEAEFSATVADEHQGRGIGTLLLATLWTLARRVGIERFRLVALSDNFPIIHWMETIGASIDCDSGTVCDLIIDLREESRGAIPMTPEGDELLDWLERLPAILDFSSPES